MDGRTDGRTDGQTDERKREFQYTHHSASGGITKIIKINADDVFLE
jgi:hypothetical protein